MDKLTCGFAQAVITPEPGTVYMDGYGFRVSPAEGVRDDLYAKVCAMKSGENEFVLVALDICGFDNRLRDCLRGWIRTYTDLKDHQFSVSATHTHAGPASGICKDLPNNYMYWDKVGKILAKTVEQARSSRVPGQFRFAFGKELTLAYNRRGKKIIDRRVPVCGFFGEDGTLVGVIASANCHAVCCKDMNLSADYPGILTREAAKKYPGTTFLFLQGHGADINPLDTKERGMVSHEELGMDLTDCVFTALDSMAETGISEGKIASQIKDVFAPMAYPPLEEVVDAERAWVKILADTEAIQPQTEATTLRCRVATTMIAWNRRVIGRLQKGIPAGIESTIQMAAIGKDAAFVFIPFELLTITGLTIEKMLASYGLSPEKCFILGYSNGTNGYLAPAAECGEGGYETVDSVRWYDTAQCIPETEETVLQTVDMFARTLLA